MDIKLSEDRFLGMGDAPTPQEIEVEFGLGVKATVSVPHAVNTPNFLELGFAPATHKMAILLHGQGGHRDYCYQKMLAHKLAAEAGMYTLRLDFRGCGSLADVADPEVGRVLALDIEDIQAAAEYVLGENALGIRFYLLAIISHLRGAVAMFLWALQQDRLLRGPDRAKAIVVPNLISCSLRFRSYTVMDRYPLLDDDFRYVEQLALRYGKIAMVPVTKAELQLLAAPDFSVLRDLSLEWSVLSVAGTEDLIIPKEDVGFFANVLNRAPYSHHTELIEGADHNFYGTELIEHDFDAEEHNRHNLPLTRKKLVNYNYVVSALIVKYLRSDQELLRFLARAQYIGGAPRMKKVDGVSNFRDIGGWPIHRPTFAHSGAVCVRPNLIFRSANTAGLTDSGARSITKLGIRTVFDLRSEEEVDKDGVPPLATTGATRVHAPVFPHEDYSPEQLALRRANLITLWHTYIDVYDSMLERGTPSFRTMFEHILHRPNDPLLFHCTAGKDRTGVFAMLVLKLAGVDDFTIAKEYEITAEGFKPDHERLKAKFDGVVDKLRANDPTGEKEAAIVLGRKNWSLEKDGFANLVSSRSEAMFATLELLEGKYGGILNYMENNLGFSSDEVRKIFDAIVVPCDGESASSCHREAKI